MDGVYIIIIIIVIILISTIIEIECPAKENLKKSISIRSKKRLS